VLSAIAKNLAHKDNIVSLPPVSTLNGRYAIKNSIGAGGICETFSVVDKRADYFRDRREIAVKIPLAEMALKEDIAAFLYAEYCFLARVTHPNVVRAFEYDIDRKSKIPFIVMERLNGERLNDVAAKLSVKEKIAVLAALSRAVDYIHSLGIVHADINPKNIVVSDSNVAKLLDFGVAVDLHGSKPFYLNRKNVKAFNPLYAAPEAINGEMPAIESDIFSLAATFFETFSGELPYKESPIELLESPVAPDRLKAIPFVLRSWFRAALKADSNKRPSQTPAVFKRGSIYETLARFGSW
jgi:serine/threonine protein kinase